MGPLSIAFQSRGDAGLIVRGPVARSFFAFFSGCNRSKPGDASGDTSGTH